MTNKRRLSVIERVADEAMQRQMEARIEAEFARMRTADQRLVWLWAAESDLATERGLPPAELAEVIAFRDANAAKIDQREAAEPGFRQRVERELVGLGLLV